jgi:hypothetical protein
MYWYARAIDEFSSDSDLIEADRLGAAAACATFVQTSFAQKVLWSVRLRLCRRM